MPFLLRAIRNLLAVLGLIVLTVTLTPLTGAWATWLTGKRWDEPKGDTLIVIGAESPQLGNLLGQTSYWRALYAVRAWRSGHFQRVVICGGNGIATSIASYMTAHGVPPDAVRLEDRSMSTVENARFAAEILRPLQHGRIALLSSDIHMRRAVATFEKAGLRDLVVIPSPDALKRCGSPFQRWPVCLELTVETAKLAWYRWKGYI